MRDSPLKDSLAWITAHLGLSPKLEFSGGRRGWVGDNPFILLDTRRIRARGWRSRLTIREGVIRTLEYLQSHPGMLEARR